MNIAQKAIDKQQTAPLRSRWAVSPANSSSPGQIKRFSQRRRRDGLNLTTQAGWVFEPNSRVRVLGRNSASGLGLPHRAEICQHFHSTHAVAAGQFNEKTGVIEVGQAMGDVPRPA